MLSGSLRVTGSRSVWRETSKLHQNFRRRKISSRRSTRSRRKAVSSDIAELVSQRILPCFSNVQTRSMSSFSYKRLARAFGAMMTDQGRNKLRTIIRCWLWNTTIRQETIVIMRIRSGLQLCYVENYVEVSIQCF